jgi:xylulokinase
VLDIAEIRQDTLPIPVQAGTLAGRLNSSAAASLGVTAGTPVVVGGHDQVVGAVGLGVISAGRAAGSLGTYECIVAASDHLLLSEAALNSSLNSYPHAVPGKFVTIAYFPAGIMLQWMKNLFYGAQNEDDGSCFVELESEAPADPTSLLITPHLIGSCNPEFDSEASGVISGLRLDSTRPHLYKGILEGIASEFAIITECLENAGSTFAHINVSGGGTRSPFGVRLRAALTNKTLHIMDCQESVCLGGAMLASVAVGVHQNLDVAAQAMVQEKQSVRADPLLAGQYDRQFRDYCQLRSALVHRHKQETQPSGEQK